MTDKLLEVYLKCFRDDYISVRELACKSSQNLYETNPRIIDALIFMAKFDQVSRLKALAIQSNNSYSNSFRFLIFSPLTLIKCPTSY